MNAPASSLSWPVYCDATNVLEVSSSSGDFLIVDLNSG